MGENIQQENAGQTTGRCKHTSIRITEIKDDNTVCWQR
jgi:hypothetical protein